MTKQHFIALADWIRSWNHQHQPHPFTIDQVVSLANFCESQNSAFDRYKWLNYIAGTHGPNGGKK